MMNEIKKNELTETEMDSVAGGLPYGYSSGYFDGNFAEAQKQHQIHQAINEMKRKQAEAAQQSGAHAHGGGASGGW